MTTTADRTTVLILGGGQLARMFVEAAPKLDVQIHVYAQGQDESATKVTNNFTVGALNDESLLRGLFSKYKKVTFENEFIPYPLCNRLVQETSTTFVPSLEALALTQDKLQQKKLFNQLQIPTAEFAVYDGPENSEETFRAWLETRLNQWQAVVLKWSRFGYDGKGNLVVHNTHVFEKVLAFYHEGQSKGATIYAERKIDFTHEVAIQVVHTLSPKNLIFYPLVTTIQKNGICAQVRGPATSFGIDKKIEREAHDAGNKIAAGVPLTGLFAIEGFVTPQGTLLINEIAPRVHNSGHYTQHASTCSQFENHLRAVLGMPLITPSTAAFFGMINILGPSEISRFSEKIRMLQEQARMRSANNSIESGESFYWYDKTIRSGRKLGHINIWSDTQKDLDSRFFYWLEQLK